MVLLVIDMLCGVTHPSMNMNNFSLTYSIEPVEVDYNMTRQCYIGHYNNFIRRNYMSCINRSLQVIFKPLWQTTVYEYKYFFRSPT